MQVPCVAVGLLALIWAAGCAPHCRERCAETEVCSAEVQSKYSELKLDLVAGNLEPHLEELISTTIVPDLTAEDGDYRVRAIWTGHAGSFLLVHFSFVLPVPISSSSSLDVYLRVEIAAEMDVKLGDREASFHSTAVRLIGYELVPDLAESWIRLEDEFAPDVVSLLHAGARVDAESIATLLRLKFPEPRLIQWIVACGPDRAGWSESRRPQRVDREGKDYVPPSLPRGRAGWKYAWTFHGVDRTGRLLLSGGLEDSLTWIEQGAGVTTIPHAADMITAGLAERAVWSALDESTDPSPNRKAGREQPTRESSLPAWPAESWDSFDVQAMVAEFVVLDPLTVLAVISTHELSDRQGGGLLQCAWSYLERTGLKYGELIPFPNPMFDWSGWVGGHHQRPTTLVLLRRHGHTWQLSDALPVMGSFSSDMTWDVRLIAVDDENAIIATAEQNLYLIEVSEIGIHMSGVIPNRTFPRLAIHSAKVPVPSSVVPFLAHYPHAFPGPTNAWGYNLSTPSTSARLIDGRVIMTGIEPGAIVAKPLGAETLLTARTTVSEASIESTTMVWEIRSIAQSEQDSVGAAALFPIWHDGREIAVTVLATAVPPSARRRPVLALVGREWIGLDFSRSTLAAVSEFVDTHHGRPSWVRAFSHIHSDRLVEASPYPSRDSVAPFFFCPDYHPYIHFARLVRDP